jgi:hypothetical protein
MAQNDNKISNVIGTHIPNWLLGQLQTRSKKGTLDSRDNANLLYLGNKSGWVRLVSSINITAQSDKNYFSKLTGLTLTKAEDLAKNFVLYGGVSKYNNQSGKNNYALRKGFKETYSLLGDQEVRDFGYRPMPGLTRVVIETQGRLGSIRSANIEFKVWDKSQLDVMDALYFKLGYSMFLEWGNTFYYTSDSDDLKSSELFSLDPFKEKLDKGEINKALGKSRRESQGNYDGMLGLVTNFSFSYNQEGGYDCVLKLVGIGAIADSLQINQPATLPNLVKAQVEALNSIYAQIQKQNEATVKAEEDKAAATKKAAEEKLALEQLEASKEGKDSIFKSLLGKQQLDKGLDENSVMGSYPASLIEESFFRKYALPPSKLVSSNKTLDYTQRGQYDYIYEDLLYLTKQGIILQGNSGYSKEITNIVERLSLDASYISTVIFGGQSIAALTTSGFSNNLSEFSKRVTYFSNTNAVNNSTYKNGYPYEFSAKLTFVDTFNGNNITYGNTKATIASEFLKQLLKEREPNLKFTSYFLRIDNNNKFALFIKGDFSWGLNLNTTKTEFSTATGRDETKTIPSKDTLKLPFTIQIEDSSLIAEIILKASQDQTSEYIDYKFQQKKLADQNAGRIAAEKANPTSNTSTEQTKSAVQYQSSLEAMLRAIQVYSLQKALKETAKIDLDRKVKEVSLTEKEFVTDLFSNGIFKDYIDAIVNKTLDEKDPIQKNIKYGFNAAILSNKITDIPKGAEVDYKALLMSYVLPYEINQDLSEGTRLNHPVYIQLGLLMFIINHCCNLYDKKQEEKKTTPLLYIDYNPQTNFCLSHPCHMTSNAMTFLIPFEGTFDDYKTLFFKEVLSGDNIISTDNAKPNDTTALYNPANDDTVSGDLPRFKGLEKIDTYRGRIMNVLVNIDYVFDIIKQFFSQDQTNTVYLKAFVEQVLSDMNKTLGNFNIFRFSYDDSANCLQIVDDQLVPGFEDEIIVPKNSSFDLPVYGKKSIARSLDLRTDISNRISSTLAISANAEVQKKSSNSVDGTPFGYINESYEDRILGERAEYANITRDDKTGILSLPNANILSGTIASSIRFNKNVKDFYGTYNPSMENVNHAAGYLIEKLSKNKLDAPTRAAAMIPVSINFSLDGISGFNMMQGFTIPDQFLPYTYNIRKVSEQAGSGDKKVGFMTTGNVHTIENNQWITTIKANMTYLKGREEFQTRLLNTGLTKGRQATFNPENAGSSNTTNFVASNTQAQNVVETYLGRQISSKEFSDLISAIFAEASNNGGGPDNQKERAYVAAVILNRTRKKYLGANTISETLTKPVQFEAVTGNSLNGNSPRPNFLIGPDPATATQIYSALVSDLSKVPDAYLFFTAYNIASYEVKGGLKNREAALKGKGSITIGGTIFSITT